MNVFNLKKLNEVEFKEEHKVGIPNRFAALESLEYSRDIKRAWEILEKI
jgi:uncharacterized metal-binding protein YceD (DUF177 family)